MALDILGALTPSGTRPEDEVQLVVRGRIWQGWQAVRITRGVERCPSDFDIEITERFPGVGSKIAFQPGDPCQVNIGPNNPVIVGYIDRYSPSIGPRRHSVRISGRGVAQDLVDCSAVVSGMAITTNSLLKLATDLCAPFGVKVVSLTGDNVPVGSRPNGTGDPVQFSIVLTETPYELIERVARYVGVLVYEDDQGRLVLARPGATKMASGFEEGANVQEAAAVFSVDERYSDYIPRLMNTDGLSQLGTANKALFDTVYDTAMVALPRHDGAPRYRPIIIVSEQTQNGDPLATKRAAFEAQRRRGRSQAVRLTCDSWRDVSGILWKPNALAPVRLPSLKIDDTWVITEVTFLRDGSSGTTAELMLMPAEALSVQPTPLQAYDWQVDRAVNPGSGGAQAPADKPGPGHA